MANKREQRLRRKARAKLAEAVRDSLKARSMMPVASAAVRYISEIDAPNLREPWSIDSRRRELRAIVHQYLGRAPERRATALVGPLPMQPAAPAPRTVLVEHRPAPARTVTPATGTRLELLRDLDLKRRELRLAAQRFGAVANDRGHRTDATPLAELMERAALAFVRAEQRLADAGAVSANLRGPVDGSRRTA